MVKGAKTMDDAGRALVTQAVATAEHTTSGEIVIILAESSGSYRAVALGWAAFAGFAALAVAAVFPAGFFELIDRLDTGWNRQWTAADGVAWAAALGIFAFVGVWALQLWRPARLFLLPDAIAAAHVRARALDAFRIGAEARTHGRTGVVIYLSLAEHRAEIVAYEAIASKVPAETWGDAMEAMLAEVREGRLAEGMAAAVSKTGAVLALHFPKDSADTNQLPDRLIEL